MTPEREFETGLGDVPPTGRADTEHGVSERAGSADASAPGRERGERDVSYAAADERARAAPGAVARPGRRRRERPGRWERLTPRARALTIGTLVVLLLGGVALAVAASRRDEREPRGAPAGGMANMAGMPGMMASGSSVRLTAAQIREFGVTFGTADVRPLASETRTTGVVTVDETKLAQVAPKFGGFVERLYVNATGQPVRRGQPLLAVYSPELIAAQQELLVAGQLQHDIGRSSVPGVPGSTTDLVAAARRRLELWDVSSAQVEEVFRTGRVRRTLTLYAPASGVVLEKRVVQGQAIMPGEPLYTIVDLSDVWVDVQLREADAAAVRPGSRADIEVTGLPGRALEGRVVYVYPTLDSASRALRARVVVSNAGRLLKPGMYATVRLTTPQRSALTVPTAAVLRTGDRNVVFVDMGSGELMPHEVELGRTAGDLTEVLAGLEPGQRVVTSAQFLFDSESNLGEVMRSMMGQAGASDLKQMGDMPGTQMPVGGPPPEMNDEGAGSPRSGQMRDMPGMSPPKTATPRR